MTLVSPVDGIIIEREVVPQNYYETSSVLMVIAPLDHLWVLVNVYELDQDKVAVGQTMEIQFPFLEEKSQGQGPVRGQRGLEGHPRVSVRASIPNPGARLKADMVVKAMLEIPPVQGQTSIHRLAMVSTNGSEYVFVRRPRTDDDTSAGSRDGTRKRADQFERRKIEVAQESHDIVVVHSGLEPGEVVATNGSLILASSSKTGSRCRPASPCNDPSPPLGRGRGPAATRALPPAPNPVDDRKDWISSRRRSARRSLP